MTPGSLPNQKPILTDNQSVDPSISKANEEQLCNLIERSVKECEVHRNQYAVLSGSMQQDWSKCKDLYDGKLYSRRMKKQHECKEFDYQYYVNFNAMLMRTFDYKDYVKTVTEDENSENQKNALDITSMTRLVQYCLRRSKADEREEDMLRFMGMYGNGFYKFEPYTDDGQNWPGHKVIDTRHIGMSPGATDVDDAVFIYYRRPVPTSELKDAFPDKAKDIEPDKEISFDLSKGTDEKDVSVMMNLSGHYAQSFANGLKDLFTGNTNQYKQTRLTEFYYKDPETQKITNDQELDKWLQFNPGFGSDYTRGNVRAQYLQQMQENPEGITVKKYPFGRCLLKCNNIILDDYPNPYPFFPFVNTKCYRRPNEAWAMGVIHMIREPIQNKQMISSGMAYNADNRLKSIYTVSGAAAEQVGNLKRIPTENNTLINLGQVPGAEIKKVPVEPVAPQDIVTLIEYRRKTAEMVSGLESVLGGVNQVGTYSGVQFEKQLEQAMGKVKPRFDEVNRAREALGEMYLWFIQNWMTDQRRIDFLSDGEKQIYFTINQMQSVDGQPVTTHDVTKGKYKYFIDSGTNQPISKAERASQIQEAAKMIGAFDPVLAVRMTLEQMDIPGKAEMLARFDKAVQAKMGQMDQQQQQQFLLEMQKLNQQKQMNERQMLVKEEKAASEVQTAIGSLVANFAKAGYAIPSEVVQRTLAASQIDVMGVLSGAPTGVQDGQQLPQNQQQGVQPAGNEPGT